jgi:hypothetical protein
VELDVGARRAPYIKNTFWENPVAEQLVPLVYHLFKIEGTVSLDFVFEIFRLFFMFLFISGELKPTSPS